MAEEGGGVSPNKGASLLRFAAAVNMAGQVLNGRGATEPDAVRDAILACYRGIEEAEQSLSGELERDRTPARIGLRKD